MLQDFFNQSKNDITRILEDFLNKKKDIFKKINPWGNDVIERLKKFSSQGKMLRGSLLLSVANLFSKAIDHQFLLAAASLELVQAALLIHDDIMDKDEMRRGEKTIFYQYKNLGDAEKLKESYHFGQSMGICAGDIGFFLAYEILSTLNINAALKEKIIQFASRELSLVGLAQMQDIYAGMSSKKVSEEEIIKLYLYKTARYTFSLPFVTGALLADITDASTLDLLEKIGENIGIIFQIKDDEMGIFELEKDIGKPIGSDIIAGKKTLLTYYLFEKALEEDKALIFSLIGNSEINPEKLSSLLQIFEKYKIREICREKINLLAVKARELIDLLPIQADKKNILLELLLYNLDRKK